MRLMSWRRRLDLLDAPNVMSIQHLRNRDPVVLVVVGLTAFLVVATSLALALRASSVDPRVTLEPGSGSSFKRSIGDVPSGIATAMDGEVAHTAERIGEATALALSAGLYAATEQLNRRTPRGVRDLLAGVALNGLTPPGLVVSGSEGTFVSAHGSLSVRYRPAPLGVEIVSVGSKPEYGPALIVRVPGATSEEGEARLYIAGSLTGVTVPAPFAPEAELIALGWSPERLRSLK
jgi:hypothetical protein